MKMMFVWFRRVDLTHEQSLSAWGGAKHVSIVRTVPGLKKWVHNRVTNPGENAPDGIGELWFDSAQAMEQAWSSARGAAAMEDGKRFADMERSYGLVVEERTVIGQEASV